MKVQINYFIYQFMVISFTIYGAVGRDEENYDTASHPNHENEDLTTREGELAENERAPIALDKSQGPNEQLVL